MAARTFGLAPQHPRIRRGPKDNGRRLPSGRFRGVFGASRPFNRIQKLREGHQALPIGRGHPALPVGGGPRNAEWFGEDFRALLELLRAEKIHPVVAERLPLSDARRAHELLESSASKGKLVLMP